MAQLRCVVFGVENVLTRPGLSGVDEHMLAETGKLVRYLDSRGVGVAVISNRDWTRRYADGRTVTLESALKKDWGVDFRWLKAGVDVDFKQRAKAMEDLCSKLGLKKNEIVFVGNTDVDMQSAINGGVLLLNAQWYGKTMDYGFEFSEPKEIARFVDIFCLREHFWYFVIEQDELAVYALAPYSTREADSTVYSYDFLKAVKDELGDGADFWAKYLCTSMYFSGLYESVNYIAPYPRHAEGRYPTVLESPIKRFLHCFRRSYLPDLIVRHTTAAESKKDRSAACHANQINTIHLNKAPFKKPGETYKKFPITAGKTVVILDDILTEGYSLDTARLYLAQTGARVICVSLLKTINRAYCHAPSVTLPNGPFQPNFVQPQSVRPLQHFSFHEHAIDPEAAADLTSRLKRYRKWDANWPA